MSKYDRLTQHLGTLSSTEWRASFHEIETILGFELPASALEHPAWWANQAGGHAQSSSWQDAGWRTENLDLASRVVTFTRRHWNALGGSSSPPAAQRPFLNALAPRASNSAKSFLSGLTDPISPLTISQAKAGLSAYFGVSEECIEITIKG